MYVASSICTFGGLGRRTMAQCVFVVDSAICRERERERERGRGGATVLTD